MSQPQSIQDLFLEAIALSAEVTEAAQPGLDLSPADPALVKASQACSKFTTVIESLLMAVAGLHAVTRLVPLTIEELKKSGHPGTALGMQMESALAATLSNFAALDQAYEDEITVAKKFNKLVASRLLVDKGINPDDHAAVKQFVDDHQKGTGGGLNPASLN